MSFFKNVVGFAQQVIDNLSSADDQTPDQKMRHKYRLPDTECIVTSVDCLVSVAGSDRKEIRLSRNADIPQEVTLTTNYVVFDNSEDKSVLHLAGVKEIKKAFWNDCVCITLLTVTGWRLFLRIDELRSTSDRFFTTLEHHWHSNKMKQSQLIEFTKDMFSEWLVMESQTKGHRPMHELPGGLGLDHRFPGYLEKEARRRLLKNWYSYFKLAGRSLTLMQTGVFKKLIYQGMANEARGELWELTSGALYYRFENYGEYSRLLNDNANKSSAALDDIEKDLNRSLPEYSAYQSADGINKLRRVLSAYSWKVPEVGYCQGMNILTAALLIFMNEEQAFWTLYVICEKIIPGYYTKTMYGALLDQRVFEELINKHIPVLGQHFQKHDIKVSIISLPWFLSFFLTTMPLIFAFDILDRFFEEGVTVLFKISLAIVKVNGKELLECEDIGECIAIFKDYFSQLDETEAYINGNKTKFDHLKETAFKEFGYIKESEIIRERVRNQDEVIKYIDEFVKRTEIRNLSKDHLRNLTGEQISNIYDLYYSVLMEDSKSKPNDGNGQMTMAYFKNFMSRLVPWVDLKYENQQMHSQNAFLRRLYNHWSTNKNNIDFESLINGLDKLVDRDGMRLITAFFELYDDAGNGLIPKHQIMEVADDLVFITTPWRDGVLFDKITNTILEKKIAEVLIKRQQKLKEQGVDVETTPNSIPSSLSYDREKYEKLQYERYLASGSNFLKLAFQYAISMDSSDDQNGEIKNNLIEIDEAQHRQLEAITHNKALDPSTPLYINESTFRMVIVTDETYSSFFDNDFWSSFKVNEQTNIDGSSYGAMMSNLRGAVNVVMTSGQRVATEVRKQMDDTRQRKDSIRSARSIGSLNSVGTLNSAGTNMPFPNNVSMSNSSTKINSKNAESIGNLTLDNNLQASQDANENNDDDNDDFTGLLSPTGERKERFDDDDDDDDEGDFDDEDFGTFVPAGDMKNEDQASAKDVEKLVHSLIDL